MTPSKYDLLLKPDLKEFTFDGEVTIHVDVSKATNTVKLHAKEVIGSGIDRAQVIGSGIDGAQVIGSGIDGAQVIRLCISVCRSEVTGLGIYVCLIGLGIHVCQVDVIGLCIHLSWA